MSRGSRKFSVIAAHAVRSSKPSLRRRYHTGCSPSSGGGGYSRLGEARGGAHPAQRSESWGRTAQLSTFVMVVRTTSAAEVYGVGVM